MRVDKLKQRAEGSRGTWSGVHMWDRLKGRGRERKNRGPRIMSVAVG